MSDPEDFIRSESTTPARTIVKKKKGPHPRRTVFGSYSHAVMKQLDGEVSIAADAMLVVDGIVVDFMDRLMAASFKMAKYDNKQTLKVKHARGAVNNMLRGELCKSALLEGDRAYKKFFPDD